jgi:hypothetical protein
LPLVVLGLVAGPGQAQDAAIDFASWSDARKEEFLRQAKVVERDRKLAGITGSSKLSLEEKGVMHDAHFQTVDIEKRVTQLDHRRVANFRDSYKYNIAAYRLDRLLGLGMVPVSIERSILGDPGALTWWVDDVSMTEGERIERQLVPPDLASWNDQRVQARVFTQLIYNTDPNQGNFLVTKQWNLVMIDFTRAFRLHAELLDESVITRVDQRFYDGLARLDETSLREELGDFLTKAEIKGLLARAQRIRAIFDERIERYGRAAVICELPGH